MSEESSEFTFPDAEKRRAILKRIFAERMQNPNTRTLPFVAARLLNPERHAAALESREDTLRRLSQVASEGRNVICSYAFVNAHIDHLDGDARKAALNNIYQTGSPVAVVNPFSELKND